MCLANNNSKNKQTNKQITRTPTTTVIKNKNGQTKLSCPAIWQGYFSSLPLFTDFLYPLLLRFLVIAQVTEAYYKSLYVYKLLSCKYPFFL